MNSYNDIRKNLSLLNLLSKQYPTLDSAINEIINLQAILKLPKGTEHFLSDIHGEHEAFNHVLKNGSGVIRSKIDEVFGSSLTEKDKDSLAILIYYPEEKLDIEKNSNNDICDWYRVTLYRLVEILRTVSSKYTRSKVRKAISPGYVYIIEELLNEQGNSKNKLEYYYGIINSIIEMESADSFIIAICNLIQRLSIDRLHIIGDIFDRGPGAEKVMETLLNYHSVDIQWGNHDIVWIGAAAGSTSCIANVLRICLRYGNITTLEQGYGINLRPLATFVLEYYKDDPCTNFYPKNLYEEVNQGDMDLFAKMHKAITIIQFKLESEIIKRQQDFEMEDRLFLDKINYEKGTITLEDAEYELKDKFFPTIDPKDPYKLNSREEELVNFLKKSFLNSQILQKHIRFLLSKGSMYLVCNSNLLYHGCMLMKDTTTFLNVKIDGKYFSGKELLDVIGRYVSAAYFNSNSDRKKAYGLDLIWYLWCGKNSPIFAKDKMATFERYLLDDVKTHKEQNAYYYSHREDKDMCNTILREFSLNEDTSKIINGHVPVKEKKGEDPVKCGGKMIVIDGGFALSYHTTTGLAGYTLIYNSHGLLLATHKPFTSKEETIKNEHCHLPSRRIVENISIRETVRDTDDGKILEGQIYNLKLLVEAYKTGDLKESHKK